MSAFIQAFPRLEEIAKEQSRACDTMESRFADAARIGQKDQKDKIARR
jgi:hypothetical protein